MPFQWTIDLDVHFMPVLATGDVSPADAVVTNSALGYHKLFDASQATRR
jgi:hypothetical protein